MNRLLQVFLCLFITSTTFAQVSVIENFDSGSPAGWTDTYLNTTTQVCAVQSERDNLYSGSSTGNMTCPNQVGASNGTDVTFSIDYKVVDWSAATNPTADGWGSADLQYSTDDGANWTTAGTLDDTNDSNSNVCMTFTVTILGASVPNGSDLRFRVLNTWLAGDYYFYIDNWSATQVAADPPNCDAVLTSATTDFPIAGTVTWSAATGAPTGYKITIGSTMGGTDIANNINVGASTSYTPVGLMYSTTYYTTITPYNANGDATGCTEQSFATEMPPPQGSLCTDPINVGTLPYMSAAETTGGFGDDYSGSPGPAGCTTTSPYLNGDDIVYSYTSDEDGAIAIDLTNITDTYTGVFVYDNCADIGIACLGGAFNGFSSADLSIPQVTVANGQTIYIVVSTWASPQTTTYDLSITKNSCIAPTVTVPVDPIDNTNCPTTVDVDISIDDLGNSALLTIVTEDDMGNPAGTGGTTSMTGVFTVTNVPVPQSSWSIIVEHETDPSCNVTLGPFVLNCPPLNDNACDAQALNVDDPQVPGTNAYSTFETNESPGSCWGSSTTGNSVWYTFVAPGSGMVEITTDFVTVLTDSQLALYDLTDCNDLTTATVMGCGEDEGSTGSGWMAIIETSGAPLTGGNTYYVQVDGYSSQVGDFEIQVNELAPDNDDCATAAVLAMNTTGSLINQYFQAATASGMGPEACDAASTPTPGDIWYSINTDADGGNLIVTVEPGPNSDVVVSIYNACGSVIPEQCVDLGGNGGVETINFLANVKDENGDDISVRDADYFVRVYEKVASGEPFEIGAQGAALPIVLGSFEAKAEKQGNKVTWTTLAEINSDYVEVQSSPNGSTKWETIGTVNTAGESNSRLDYELFDYNPYEVTYYRLNAVDRDGKAEFSPVINVRRSDVLGKIVLSPNPAKSEITVQTTSNTEEIGTITVVDMTGKKLIERTTSLRKGLNTINLNLDDLQSGLYLFSLKTEDGFQVEKFVKQ